MANLHSGEIRHSCFGGRSEREQVCEKNFVAASPPLLVAYRKSQLATIIFGHDVAATPPGATQASGCAGKVFGALLTLFDLMRTAVAHLL